MIRMQVGGVELAASFWFFAVLGLFTVSGGGRVTCYILLTVAVHELGHLLVLLVCRVRIRKVAFLATGVEIRRDSGCMLGYAREIAVCLGGIAANLLAALALHLFCFHSMRTMLLVAMQLAVALFNLAPIGNLDGGQVVRLLAERFAAPSTARAISRAASFLVLGVLFGFAGFLLLHNWLNPTLPIACVYLAYQVIRGE